MKPYTLASFIIFLVHGIMAVYQYHFKTERLLEFVLYGVIVISSLYYYYLSIIPPLTILNDKAVPNNRTILWIVLVAQYIGFYLLWDSLQLKTLYWYTLDIAFLNFTYVVWDGLNWRNFSSTIIRGWVFGFDIAGLLLAIGHFFIIGHLPTDMIQSRIASENGMVIFLISCLLILQSLGGIAHAIYHFKYNPFKSLNFE